MKILTPKAFRFACTEAAIKKPGKNDLAIILSDIDATTASVFTKNVVKAAPVQYCLKMAKAGKSRAILVNSGNANACTGTQGIKDVIAMVFKISQMLNIQPSMIYPCSTGVIGTHMPMQRIIPAIDNLIANIGTSSLYDVALSIMTTDSFPKIVTKRLKLDNTNVTISAICKGAGMICPNMATMLCFILTDASVSQTFLKHALKLAVDNSFNCLSVDGDMSTNDTVIMMANGAAQNHCITSSSTSSKVFKQALFEICTELASMIAKDGEGASKALNVIVKGASSKSDAQKAARAIANSLLVKTAMYGNDANWGRIMAALGYSGARFNPDKVDITLNGVMVAKNGLTTYKDVEASLALKKTKVVVHINMHCGKADAQFFSCDLTEQYIKINAEYRT